MAVRRTLRDVIEGHPELGGLLPVDEPAVGKDMDTPADYQRIVVRLTPSGPVIF